MNTNTEKLIKFANENKDKLGQFVLDTPADLESGTEKAYIEMLQTKMIRDGAGDDKLVQENYISNDNDLQQKISKLLSSCSGEYAFYGCHMSVMINCFRLHPMAGQCGAMIGAGIDYLLENNNFELVEKFLRLFNYTALYVTSTSMSEVNKLISLGYKKIDEFVNHRTFHKVTTLVKHINYE